MKTILAGLALADGLERVRQPARPRIPGVTESVDTTVTTRSTQDTTIVTSDTTIHADTVRKEGEAEEGYCKEPLVPFRARCTLHPPAGAG